ncbi:hypothetical protein GF376_00475, partial [Candidatus Peregrinibacteria bacterium]|nr:hypothetical protein [Candidatus Peregrinibacteria bacterium]
MRNNAIRSCISSAPGNSFIRQIAQKCVNNIENDDNCTENIGDHSKTRTKTLRPNQYVKDNKIVSRDVSLSVPPPAVYSLEETRKVQEQIRRHQIACIQKNIVNSFRPTSSFPENGICVDNGLRRDSINTFENHWEKQNHLFYLPEFPKDNPLPKIEEYGELKTELKSESEIENNITKPESGIRKISKSIRSRIMRIAAAGAIALGVFGVYGNLTDSGNVNQDKTEQQVEKKRSDLNKQDLKNKKDIPIIKENTQKRIVSEEVVETATLLKSSENSNLHSLLTKGEMTLSNSGGIIESMMNPFWQLANQEQKTKLKNLQIKIQRALLVYFFENFGTPEKRLQSFKDPKLKNLWKTARLSKLTDMSKTISNEEYQNLLNFANKIFEDSRELELDKSSNSQVDGNLFAAKMPNSILNIRKNNGEFHVIIGEIDKIFNGAINYAKETTSVELKEFVVDSTVHLATENMSSIKMLAAEKIIGFFPHNQEAIKLLFDQYG